MLPLIIILFAHVVLCIVLISIFSYAPKALYRVDMALYKSYELL